MRKTKVIFFALFLLASHSFSQPFISAFIPGNYLADNNHYVEISAGGSKTNLSSYLLITRDYAVRLPEGSVASPGNPMRIAKKKEDNKPLNLELSKSPDFLIRFRDRENEGNYVVLIDNHKKIVDAFYNSPIPSVPWLPLKDTLITIRREYFDYFLPAETNQIWQYIAMGDDPAIAFKREEGTWRIVNALSNGKLAAEYRNLSLRFNEQVVTVRWSTSSEFKLKEHIIERSEDQEHFVEVDRIPASGSSTAILNYSWSETKVYPDKTYYYKIRSGESPGLEVSSRIAEVKTIQGPEEFTMDVFFLPQSGKQEVNLRFFSRYAQKIKIKILDSRMREVAILFNDYVPTDSRNLLKIGEGLASGNYFFVADTESKRFWQKLSI